MDPAQAAALVVLALEVGDDFLGRLRMRLVPDDTAASLVGFVSEVVEVGSTGDHRRLDGLPRAA
jgi:hypothetical protein